MQFWCSIMEITSKENITSVLACTQKKKSEVAHSLNFLPTLFPNGLQNIRALHKWYAFFSSSHSQILLILTTMNSTQRLQPAKCSVLILKYQTIRGILVWAHNLKCLTGSVFQMDSFEIMWFSHCGHSYSYSELSLIYSPIGACVKKCATLLSFTRLH